MVTPVLQEPLHAFEKSALAEINAPQNYGGGSQAMANQYLQGMLGQQQINPMATQYMGQAGQYTQQGAAPITMQQVQDTANPYAQVLQDKLSQSGERARQQIMSAQGLRGGQSFGDTAQGVNQGMLNEQLIQSGNQINFDTYESALGQLQQMRNRELQAGGQFGNLAQGAQGITSSGVQNQLATAGAVFGAGRDLTQQGLEGVDRRLGAGRYVRDYNQNINDIIQQNELARQDDEASRLARTMGLLQGFSSNTSTGQTIPGASTGELFGAGATAAGKLAEQLGG